MAQQPAKRPRPAQKPAVLPPAPPAATATTLPRIYVRLTQSGDISINNSPFVVTCFLCQNVMRRHARFSKDARSKNANRRKWALGKLAQLSNHVRICQEAMAKPEYQQVMAAILQAVREYKRRESEEDAAIREAALLFQALLEVQGLTPARIQTMSQEEIAVTTEDLAEMLRGEGHQIDLNDIQAYFNAVLTIPP